MQRRLRSAWASTQSDQSSLCVLCVARDTMLLNANSKDSDQTGRMLRLSMGLCYAHLSFCWFCCAAADLFWRFLQKVCTFHSWNINVVSNCIESELSFWVIKRICVFEHSVITNFNCACPAIQKGQGSGFLSEGSSWLIACMSEQRRFWRDCADAQARLNLRCLYWR